MYYKGEPGVVWQDMKKAAEHFTIAADQGRPPAMALLGKMHERGEIDGTPDYRKSAELRFAAAMAGHRLCLRWLRDQYRLTSRDGRFSPFFPEDAAKRMECGKRGNRGL